MPKKIHYVEIAKIYRPKNIVPTGITNIITNNVTKDGGNVENSSELNATYARKWVDENHL